MRFLYTIYNTHDDPKQPRGGCLCTMYDFRCTIYKIPALAREFGGARAESDCRATYGRNEKAAVAAGAAYVRFTRCDVRFGEFPRLRAEMAKQGAAPVYDVSDAGALREPQIKHAGKFCAGTGKATAGRAGRDYQPIP